MGKYHLTCVVDDQADFRFLLQKLFDLSFPQYPVRFFEQGQALLDELPNISPLPALILMDYHMPLLDGYQTLLQLKQNSDFQYIPVVMMSAEASPAEIMRCYRGGANSFLRKPTDFQVLMETVSRLGQYWLETNLKGE